MILRALPLSGAQPEWHRRAALTLTHVGTTAGGAELYVALESFSTRKDMRK